MSEHTLHIPGSFLDEYEQTVITPQQVSPPIPAITINTNTQISEHLTPPSTTTPTAISTSYPRQSIPLPRRHPLFPSASPMESSLRWSLRLSTITALHTYEELILTHLQATKSRMRSDVDRLAAKAKIQPIIDDIRRLQSLELAKSSEVDERVRNYRLKMEKETAREVWDGVMKGDDLNGKIGKDGLAEIWRLLWDRGYEVIEKGDVDVKMGLVALVELERLRKIKRYKEDEEDEEMRGWDEESDQEQETREGKMQMEWLEKIVELAKAKML